MTFKIANLFFLNILRAPISVCIVVKDCPTEFPILYHFVTDVFLDVPVLLVTVGTGVPPVEGMLLGNQAYDFVRLFPFSRGPQSPILGRYCKFQLHLWAWRWLSVNLVAGSLSLVCFRWMVNFLLLSIRERKWPWRVAEFMQETWFWSPAPTAGGIVTSLGKGFLQLQSTSSLCYLVSNFFSKNTSYSDF